VVVALLRPGDVGGDIQLLLGMAAPYTARPVADSDCLLLAAAAFEWLLAEPRGQLCQVPDSHHELHAVLDYPGQ
jgi:hypothetical protein